MSDIEHARLAVTPLSFTLLHRKVTVILRGHTLFEPSRLACRFLSLKGCSMPRKFFYEVHDRAARISLDRLKGYPSIGATAKALAPMLDIGPETLHTRTVQVQIDAGRRPGATSAEIDEIKRLEKDNCDLKEANEILRAPSMFFAGELDPRRH